MNRLSLATWNINSVRLRIDRVTAFLKREKPDVLCLQEIKCLEDQFPRKAFEAAGYRHIKLSGQKGMHGVAIVSKHAIEETEPPPFCRHGHARCAAVKVAGFELHNLYVPAGADIPDPAINEKFAHKLDFIERMHDFYAARAAKRSAPPLLVAGDINIAPEENDVWSHRQLLNVVSHTPLETDGLKRILADGKFTDIARAKHKPEEKLYTWWSYRAADWKLSNRGRRLDHWWADKRATPLVDIQSYRIHPEERGGEKPSDHVPVTVTVTAAT
jgi:exodeoxyribonuclease-3